MNKVFVIAEIGVNHNKDMNLAKKLIDIACDCNVDAVKFQLFKTEKLLSKDSPMAKYQIENSNNYKDAFHMLKRLELNTNEIIELINYCNFKNIKFMCSPFDMESIDILNELHLDIFKIPSGEITNYPYLKKIGSLKKKVILSTGMSTISEIENAIKVLKDNGTYNISLLQCNTQYPTPMKDVNLNAITTLKNKFNLEVGFSDHTIGIEVPIAAVALGATIIEKHFTLDRNLEGPDHKASLEPNEMLNMVKAIRNIELALGKGIKSPSKSEIPNINIVRKSIVAKKNIKKGEIFTEENITTKRPGTGLNPMIWEKVIGSSASKDYKEDEMITL